MFLDVKFNSEYLTEKKFKIQFLIFIWNKRFQFLLEKDMKKK